MQKDSQNLSQEFQNGLKGKTNETTNKENDTQAENSIIIVGGDPNLSPNAGKPLK
jgi:hypothetical protein